MGRTIRTGGWWRPSDTVEEQSKQSARCKRVCMSGLFSGEEINLVLVTFLDISDLFILGGLCLCLSTLPLFNSFCVLFLAMYLTVSPSLSPPLSVSLPSLIFMSLFDSFCVLFLSMYHAVALSLPLSFYLFVSLSISSVCFSLSLSASPIFVCNSQSLSPLSLSSSFCPSLKFI